MSRGHGSEKVDRLLLRWALVTHGGVLFALAIWPLMHQASFGVMFGQATPTPALQAWFQGLIGACVAAGGRARNLGRPRSSATLLTLSLSFGSAIGLAVTAVDPSSSTLPSTGAIVLGLVHLSFAPAVALALLGMRRIPVAEPRGADVSLTR